jgi:hypothetical protein
MAPQPIGNLGRIAVGIGKDLLQDPGHEAPGRSEHELGQGRSGVCFRFFWVPWRRADHTTAASSSVAANGSVFKVIGGL